MHLTPNLIDMHAQREVLTSLPQEASRKLHRNSINSFMTDEFEEDQNLKDQLEDEVSPLQGKKNPNLNY